MAQQPAAARALLAAVAVRLVSCVYWRVGADWEIAPRTTPDSMLFLPVAGRLLVTCRGRTVPLAPGAVGLWPEGLLHAVRLQPGERSLDVLAIHFRAAGPDRMPFLLGCRTAVAHLPDHRRWIDDFTDLTSLCASDPVLGERYGSLLVARLLCDLVLAGLPLAPPAGDGDPRIAAALAAIGDDGAAIPTVAELARRAGLSGVRFRQRFAAATGSAPKAFIDRHRLALAADRLRATAEPVRTVAAAAGFHGVRQFLHRFKTAYGVTPAAYRRGERSGA